MVRIVFVIIAAAFFYFLNFAPAFAETKIMETTYTSSIDTFAALRGAKISILKDAPNGARITKYLLLDYPNRYTCHLKVVVEY